MELTLWAKMDLRVMAIKRLSRIPRYTTNRIWTVKQKRCAIGMAHTRGCQMEIC